MTFEIQPGGIYTLPFPFTDLSGRKTHHVLNVNPRWKLQTAVEHNLRWYQRQAQGESARDLCEADITAFESAPQASA